MNSPKPAHAKNPPADSTDWPIDAGDLQWFLRQSKSEKHARAAFYAELNLPLHEIGEKAGYGCGTSDDPEDKKRQWAAAASRAVNSRRVQDLRARFREFKANGDRPIADERELQANLTRIARGNNPSASIQASKVLLDETRRSPDRDISEGRLPALIDAACARESIFMQTIGTASGLFYKKSGRLGFRDWAVPESCRRIESLLETAGMTPLDVVSLLIASEQSKKQ